MGLELAPNTGEDSRSLRFISERAGAPVRTPGRREHEAGRYKIEAVEEATKLGARAEAHRVRRRRVQARELGQRLRRGPVVVACEMTR